VDWYILDDVSEEHTVSIITLTTLMMGAVRSSEASVNVYQTTLCYIQKTAIFILVAVRTTNITV
jgi:phosphoribosyl-dephospho-CoA transferase